MAIEPAQRAEAVSKPDAPSPLAIAVDRVKTLRSQKIAPKEYAEHAEVRLLAQHVLRISERQVMTRIRGKLVQRFFTDPADDAKDIAADATIHILSNIEQFNPNHDPERTSDENFVTWVASCAQHELINEVRRRAAEEKTRELLKLETANEGASSGTRITGKDMASMQDALGLLYEDYKGRRSLQDLFARLGVTIASPQDMIKLFSSGGSGVLAEGINVIAERTGIRADTISQMFTRFRHSTDEVLSTTMDLYSTRAASQLDEFRDRVPFEWIQDQISKGNLHSVQFLGRLHYVKPDAVRALWEKTHPVSAELINMAYTAVGGNATVADARRMKYMYPQSVILFEGRYHILNTAYQKFREEFPDQRDALPDDREIAATNLLTSDQFGALIKVPVQTGKSMPSWIRKEKGVWVTTRAKLKEAGIIQ